eukprot:403345045
MRAPQKGMTCQTTKNQTCKNQQILRQDSLKKLVKNMSLLSQDLDSSDQLQSKEFSFYNNVQGYFQQNLRPRIPSKCISDNLQQNKLSKIDNYFNSQESTLSPPSREARGATFKYHITHQNQSFNNQIQYTQRKKTNNTCSSGDPLYYNNIRKQTTDKFSITLQQTDCNINEE